MQEHHCTSYNHNICNITTAKHTPNWLQLNFFCSTRCVHGCMHIHCSGVKFFLQKSAWRWALARLDIIKGTAPFQWTSAHLLSWKWKLCSQLFSANLCHHNIVLSLLLHFSLPTYTLSSVLFALQAIVQILLDRQEQRPHAHFSVICYQSGGSHCTPSLSIHLWRP